MVFKADRPEDTTDSARNVRLASDLESGGIWNPLPITMITRAVQGGDPGWEATLATDATRSLLATTSTKAPTDKKKPTRTKAAKKKPKPR